MSFIDMFHYKEKERQLRELRIANSRFEEEIDKYKEELSKSRATITLLKSDIRALQQKQEDMTNLMDLYAPFFDMNLYCTASMHEARKQLWNAWDFIGHNNDFERIRQQRACEPRITPLEINSQNSSGRFRGIDEDYTTSLEKCSCMDFQRHLRPCKHMYRLAHEFNVFTLQSHVDYVPEPQKILHRGRLKYIMQTVSQSCLEYFELLRYKHVIVANRFDVTPLLDLDVVEICNDKLSLLESFRKDELFSFLPENALVKKSCKKTELIDIILSSYPEIIPEIEKLIVPIQLSPYAKHLCQYI